MLTRQEVLKILLNTRLQARLSKISEVAEEMKLCCPQGSAVFSNLATNWNHLESFQQYECSVSIPQILINWSEMESKHKYFSSASNAPPRLRTLVDWSRVFKLYCNS